MDRTADNATYSRFGAALIATLRDEFDFIAVATKDGSKMFTVPSGSGYCTECARRDEVYESLTYSEAYDLEFTPDESGEDGEVEWKESEEKFCIDCHSEVVYKDRYDYDECMRADAAETRWEIERDEGSRYWD